MKKKSVARKQPAGAEKIFDVLAKHAIDESRKGKTVSLDEYRKKKSKNE